MWQFRDGMSVELTLEVTAEDIGTVTDTVTVMVVDIIALTTDKKTTFGAMHKKGLGAFQHRGHREER